MARRREGRGSYSKAGRSLLRRRATSSRPPLSNSADLLHQAQIIGGSPLLYYLASFDAVNGDVFLEALSESEEAPDLGFLAPEVLGYADSMGVLAERPDTGRAW